MADNKNNLEGFFKNRINDFDKSTDGWDLPNESVWRNARNDFPNYPQKKKWNWKLGALIVIVSTLVLEGGYIYYLKNELVKTSKGIEIIQGQRGNKNNTIAIIEKEVFKIESELEKRKLNKQNLIVSPTQKNQIPIGFILNQDELNKSINRGSASTQIYLNSKDELNSFSIGNIETTGLRNDFKIAVAESTPISFSFIEIENVFPIKKLDLISEYNVVIPKLKQKKEKFELEINYNSLNFETPLTYDFEKLEKKDFGENESSFPIQFKGGGLHLSYNIRTKLWLSVGLRRTIGGFENIFVDKLIYDKSGEYIDNEGKIINEFKIITQTGFSDSGSSIDFEIPNGTNINDGDLFEAEWNYSQKYKFTNIPVGVNYYMGNDELNCFIKVGLGWNKVSLGKHFVEARLSYDNEILPIKRNQESEKELSSQFVNGFVGAGLDYKLNPIWNARASFILEKNFIQKSEVLRSNSTSKVFNIGLSYRF